MNILDLCFPRNCPVCGGPSDREGRFVCSGCLDRLVMVPPDDGTAAALEFDGIARRLILDFKLRSRLYLKADLADFLEGAAIARYDVARVDAIVPMPLTLLHRFLRGYNQSRLLARELARRLGRTCLEGALKRKGSPRRQSGLDRKARLKNAIGTFSVPERAIPRVRSRTILLVDDIHTTGATLAAAAEALIAAGAKAVWPLALARRGL